MSPSTLVISLRLKPPWTKRVLPLSTPVAATGSDAPLNFSDQLLTSQGTDLIMLPDPLRERKKIIRLELCSFSFDFLDGHEPRLLCFVTRANARSPGLPMRLDEHEKGVAAVNTPPRRRSDAITAVKAHAI
jgi:hypothetical protein